MHHPWTGKIVVPGAMLLFLMIARPTCAAPRDITFIPSATTVDAFDFVEITLKVEAPDARNPFLDAAVDGHFEKSGGADRIAVEGFCDSADGSVYRIRFMPAAPGDYTYTVNFHQSNFTKSFSGAFKAIDAHRRGIVRV